MKSCIAILTLGIGWMAGAGCAAEGTSPPMDVADAIVADVPDVSEIPVDGALDATRTPATDAAILDAVDALEGASGFPFAGETAEAACPQLSLPVSEDTLTGSRPACALAAPAYSDVVDAAGEGVSPQALIGQPTVLWFFPAPLTPG